MPVLAVAAAVTGVLAAFAGQYGYHRDELYFLACGRHLTWGYPDQPPFVPLVARAMSGLAPGSLVVLRLPSALATGALVVLTALLTRELGGGRAAQVGVADDEQGQPVWICTRLRKSWPAIWPSLRDLG